MEPIAVDRTHPKAGPETGRSLLSQLTAVLPLHLPAAALQPLMEALSDFLYDRLRPRILVLADLDSICELADVLKAEILGEEAPRRQAPLRSSALHVSPARHLRSLVSKE